ncbi:MAG TPA: epoxide hydrolase N-terminal domain-containing protein [Candidatus Limnocylindrales bacterium]|nr:epoxide hydrolase N-terminal domain-containing protein [Candidatus Limnocylindrales bacterium]
MTFSPFRIDVSDEVLDDLRARLARTRFTERSGDQPWLADPDYLRELVSYWVDEFDWRAREAQLNALPHYQTQIGGRRMHFLRVPGARAAGAPAPLPLILSHGWPVNVAPLPHSRIPPSTWP